MNITKYKQPQEIKSGDLVLVINEEPDYGLVFKREFVIGVIDTTKREGRVYQCLDKKGNVKILHDRETGPLEYWTKREFLNVISRTENGKTINYIIEEDNEGDDEEGSSFWEIVISFLRFWD